MTSSSRIEGFDPSLVAAWLTARSIARNLPPPVPDRGGLRVDTGSETETCRWVFPRMADGLAELAREIRAPRHFLKLCGDETVLSDAAPAPWALRPLSYVMMAGTRTPSGPLVPDGYRLESEQVGPTTCVRIIAPEGGLAASGYAAEAADVFIYDRIVTSPAHQRRGLGRALMTALGAARRSRSARQILVATEDGRGLYTSLGWSVEAPYATVVMPE